MHHLDNLDSRRLQATDCYGQRFMREGHYAYHLLPAGGGAIDEDRPFTIQVRARKSAARMTQHQVSLRWNGKRFSADQETLDIEVGDLVSWHSPDQAAPAYEVVGDRSFFSSAALTNECGYSHAFGVPGTYAWSDAHGSGLHGVVRVHAVKCADRDQLAQWREKVSQATLVMINHGSAEPREVDVVAGQTVYFAVVAGPGVTVTDTRLSPRSRDCQGKSS